jgi:predicted metal-dependent hydrolase
MDVDALPPALRRGVDEFNRAYFFEAHEILEDVWRETRGPLQLFYQGLIQLAVGFYHLGNGNRRGARNQLEKGLAKLEGFQPVCQGIDVQSLCQDVRCWLNRLKAASPGELAVNREQLPKIRWMGGDVNHRCTQMDTDDG